MLRRSSTSKHRSLFAALTIAFLALILLAVDPAAPKAAEVPTPIYLPIALVAPPLPFDYAWHTFYGSEVFDWASDIATDSAGNIYVSGNSPASWLGPDGEPPVEAFPPEEYAAVVLALDPLGNYLWHTFVGGTMHDPALAIGQGGRIYLAGHAFEEWYGPAGQPPLRRVSSSHSVAVAALEPSGRYLWHTFYPHGGTGNMDLAIDRSGNVIVATESSANWEGPDGRSPLHAYTPGHYHTFGEIAVFALSPDGAYRWHTFYGGRMEDWAQAVAVGEDGSIYVTGCGKDNFAGDNGAPPLNPGSVSVDNYAVPCNVVALKLDAAGRYLWHTFWGKPSYASGTDIAIDNGGNLLIATHGDGSWLGEDQRLPLTPFSGDRDAGVLKLLPTGQYDWHTFRGGPYYDGWPRIAVDSVGRFYLTWGYFQEWEDPARPGVALYNMEVEGFAPDGRAWWTTIFGGPDHDWPTAIAAHADTVIISGASNGSWLGPDGRPPLHAHGGGGDIAVAAIRIK